MAKSLEQRFNKILKSYGRDINKRSIYGRDNQEKFSRLVHEIQSYGFNFQPDHYVKPLVEELETLVNRQNQTN